MNYYERYVGDYQRDTATLSLAEHGAYTMLLDTYYATEKPLPADFVALFRICRAFTAAEQKAVKSIANQFFPISDDGLRHNTKADILIPDALKRIQIAQTNGKKGGRPPKAKPETKPAGLLNENPAGLPNGTQRQSSPTPTPTTTSVPKGTGAAAPPEDQHASMKREIWSTGKALFASKGVAEDKAGKILGQLLGEYSMEIVLDAVRAGVKAESPDPTAYLKACCQTAVGERAKVQKNSRHNGFDSIDYSEGVTADGRIA